MNEKKYWIYKTTYMCPVCGDEDVYRNRMENPKPEDWGDRNEVKERFDYCNV